MQTGFNYVDNTLGLVQTFWSEIFQKELRENNLWTGLLADPNYTLTNVKGGDTLKISKINKPTSSIRSIGTNADSFETNVLSSVQSDLVINKRCVSAFEFEDLAMIMSQLEQENSEIREALLADVKQQANDFVKSLINPSSASPDHVLSGCTDFNLTQLSTVRQLAAEAKWFGSGEPAYILASPSYMTDMLKDTTISAANVMGSSPSPMLENRFVLPRLGFSILEDNSLGSDEAYAFIPSFLKVIIGQPVFRLSDLHASKKFGFVLSCDCVLGAVQLDDERVIKIYNA